MSNWRRGSEQTEYDLLIPANSMATVVIETTSPTSVRVAGRDAAHAEGVINTVLGANTIQLVLGSGRYQIIAANAAAKRRESR
jgi:hypothetical protein